MGREIAAGGSRQELESHSPAAYSLLLVLHSSFCRPHAQQRPGGGGEDRQQRGGAKQRRGEPDPFDHLPGGGGAQPAAEHEREREQRD